MLRNNSYAIYKGNEYLIGYSRNGKYYLLAHKDDLTLKKIIELEEEGFFLEDDKYYIKEPITQSEVTEVYRIRTYAIYQGRRFSVENERNNGGEYLINYIDNKKEDEKYLNSAGFHMRDPRMMEYNKWIPKEEVEKLFEEKQHARYFDAKEPIGGNGSIEYIVLYEKKAQ